MSIFKDTFRGYVRDQLATREALIDIGNTNDSGKRTNRGKEQSFQLHNGTTEEIQPGAYYSYTLNKQCGIRMTSLVDYVSDVNLEIGGYGVSGDAGFARLKGASLSQNFILEGGVLSDFARNIKGEKKVKRATTPRESFPRPGLKTNLGYGDLALGSDATSDGYGIVPMPGITNATIRTKSAYGSLREAKINFECHNKRQLEVLEMLYMRPGYMSLVEWGWSPFINNKGNIISDLRLVEDALRLSPSESLIYTNDCTEMMIYNAINRLKEQQSGNYDGFLGFVKNFGFKAREDGGFSCFTEMISMGEVIESLKSSNISTFGPTDEDNDILRENKKTSSDGKTSPADNKITTNFGNQHGGGSGNYQYNPTKKTSISLDDFNKASLNVFPSYNGLQGLTKSLKNYATFNSFTLSSVTTSDYDLTNSNNVEGELLYNDELEDIFPELSDDYVENASENKKNEEIASGKVSSLGSAQNNAGYGISKYHTKTYLRDLLRFQAETVQASLLKKLSLNSPEELRNYLIPRGGFQTDKAGKIKKSTATKGVWVAPIGLNNNYYAQLRNDQPYIRWDAFCILINDALIPSNEKRKNPINIISDRIYDLDNNQSRLDPLTFAPITEYNAKTKTNSIIDFSTDANVCILPLQFYAVGDNMIEGTLGYKPDLTTFPSNYIVGLFEKTFSNPVREIIYNEKPITTDTIILPKQAKRRIGNIFLNLNMIDEIATKNADNEDYTIGNFINDIWGKVNKVCPNHNFVLVDDKESTNIYIIDLPVDSTEVPLNLHTFIPFSNKNILRNFEYTSNIPSAMSTTIAIGAQNPKSIQDIDGVTFAAFNRSIKNRLASTDITPNFEKTRADIEAEVSKQTKLTKQLKIKLDGYNNQFFRNLSLEANDQILQGGNISGTLREYQKMKTYISVALDTPTTFNSVIPLEFSTTLDGISGIVIGNMFKVQKDRLPKAYSKANIGFIVFNEEQKITAGGDWTTDISGKMTILPDPTKKRAPLEDYNTQLEEEYKESEQSKKISALQMNFLLSSVEITPLTDGKSPGEESLKIIISTEAALTISPAPSYAINEYGANVESIIPNRAGGGKTNRTNEYEFIVSKASFLGSMDAKSVRVQNLSVPKITSISFSDFDSTSSSAKIIITTQKIDEDLGRARLPGEEQKPPVYLSNPPIIITLSSFQTTIKDTENNLTSLVPNLSV